jgi:CheY-like chemotaxis protein
MESWVLVVDDDEDVRDIVVTALTFKGYRAHGAAHGRDALEKLRRGEVPPALLVLDLEMPMMNGWELIDELKKDARLSAIPYVLFSGYGRLEEIAAALGATAWVPKSDSIFDLLSVVERCTPRLSAAS